jgi:hypothetical protein
MIPDHRGELEPIEAGHADVHEDDGYLVLEEMLESLTPGGGLDEILAKALQDDFVAEKLRRLIVDQKDVDFV